MCHSDESRPPTGPVSTGVAAREDLQLSASDGTRIMAHAARPAQPTGRGIVLLPDIRGLHAFYRELAELFADSGFDTIAIDYFGRTADTEVRTEPEFDCWPHVRRTTPENIAADTATAIGYLRGLQHPPQAVFTIGFCFGGTNSWRQAGHGHGIAGAIGFYGGRPLDGVGPWIPSIDAPLLMLLAGVDSTTPEEFAEFAQRVRARGVDVESHTYEGAPHSFFDRSFADHRAACEDSWRRILDFTLRHSPAGASGHAGGG